MRNTLDLRFVIYDFTDITHEEISEKLGVNPTFVSLKGKRKNPKNADSPLLDENRWGINSGMSKYDDFDTHMDALLDILEPKLEILKSICPKYYCEISCGMFVYLNNGESTPWVHLNSRYNKFNKDLNIEFDLDLYVLPSEIISDNL